MKERPILMSGPMVRAILNGTKTQTRRIVKGARQYFCDFNGVGNAVFTDDENTYKQIRCPHGNPGDRLWVREAWCHKADDDGCFVLNAKGAFDASCAHYAADGYDVSKLDGDGFTALRKDGTPASPWIPSIHMPRWASRITLEVTGVRVERLQDISEADALAEGAPPSHPSIDRISRKLGFADFSRSWFGQLWERINGPGSWSANPWVWVIEFRRMKGKL